MRIIGGHLKGLLIQPPKGLPVRPTTDRAKESLFNILVNHFDLEGLRVLDLFSGTGNISYEFCSRGAGMVLAVDASDKCIRFIETMKLKHRLTMLTTVKKDAFAFLRHAHESFDLIFADAPYAHKDLAGIPSLIRNGKLLSPDGWLIIEHDSNLDFRHESGYFDKRVYGQSTFSFFRSV